MNPQISATATSASGRYVISARHNHFVADATETRGGPGEAPGAAELFLSALVTCGFALIGEALRKNGLDAATLSAQASYSVDASDGTRFEWVDLRFTSPGLAEAHRGGILAAFTSVCPIYNTVARDTRVDVALLS